MQDLLNILQDPFGFHYVPGKTPLSEWWQPASVSVGYLVLIFSIKAIMSFREKGFGLKMVTAIHNYILLLVSIVCFVGMVHGLYEKLVVRFSQLS